ncbi:HEAT repeat domain-containing protein [candidate division KSB1 bacterium]|nr:HEAT repeat domain-containing protein [candidate division KSB1 bacterium]MBL7095708.1 HEAT repeat domain-containing protein [candidate division KSB1 bacterium]
MKFKLITTVVLILFLMTTIALFGQEIDEKKLEQNLQKLEQKLMEKEQVLRSIEIPEMNLDLSGLEESMIHLEHSLSHLEHIEIPDIHVEIPEIDIEVPEIHVGIPEIHVPEIDLDLSHLDFDCGEFHFHHWDRCDLFDDLSEDEEVKVSAIRSMGRQEAEKAVPALKRTIEKELNPAYRYEAVRQLRKFVDENTVLETLAKVAKSDKNVEVRKKAIHVLGKSEDPKAVKILKEIAER